MKTYRRLAFGALALLTASHVYAAPQLTLALDESGAVTIAKDGMVLGTVMARTVDTSTGQWRDIRVRVDPQEGSKIEWTAQCTFPDGSVVDRTTTMEVEGSHVKVESAWPTESQAPGFGMIVLLIPEETAGDLTVEAGNKVIFNTAETTKSYGGTTTTEQLVFRKASTGEFLFSAKSSDPRYSLAFNSEDMRGPLQFRIGSQKPVGQPISQETSLSAEFSFEE